MFLFYLMVWTVTLVNTRLLKYTYNMHCNMQKTLSLYVNELHIRRPHWVPLLPANSINLRLSWAHVGTNNHAMSKVKEITFFPADANCKVLYYLYIFSFIFSYLQIEYSVSMLYKIQKKTVTLKIQIRYFWFLSNLSSFLHFCLIKFIRTNKVPVREQRFIAVRLGPRLQKLINKIINTMCCQ